MMKVFFAWLVLVTTLVGVFPIQHAEAAAKASFCQSVADLDLGCSDQSTGDSSEDCHDCHIGHCLFTIQSEPALSFSLMPVGYHSVMIQSFLSASLGNLLRPPIA